MYATAIPGGGAGESDDENLSSSSDEEYVPDPQHNNFDDIVLESDSGLFF